MISSLCVTLVAVHALRMQHISHNDVRESEAEVIYPWNRLNDALTLSHRSTSVLQLRPLDAQDIQVAFPVYKPWSKEPLEKAKAQEWREAEMEFKALLAAASADIINVAKAVAKADHDHQFHQGYYRAVKADAAAKAAIEAADEAIAKAEQKAKVSAAPVVLKVLLEHTELDKGAGVFQLLDHMEKRIKAYVEQVEELSAEHPGHLGAESFLEAIQLIGEQVKAMKAQAFDGEVMTKISLQLFRMMLEVLDLHGKVTHGCSSIRRALQQDKPPEMSNKMKKEVGLFWFLKHIAEIEKNLNLRKGTSRMEGLDKAG